MKLRIKGNSVRLRLGRSEVHRLATNGIVEESTVFGPSGQQAFTYAIFASSEISGISANFEGSRLLISVPSRTIHEWSTTDQVGIHALQRNGKENGLQILIEKDFECVDGRPGESQEDAFANPQLPSQKFAAACRAVDGVE
jgi:hypothetical protein